MKKYLFIIFGVLLFAHASFAQEVKVLSVEGSVEVTPEVTMRPEKPKVDMLLGEGTKIVTKGKSSIELSFNEDATNVVKVSENSHVVIKLDGEDKIELIDGELYALLKDLGKGETFQVRTPSAVCGARGTGWQMSTDGMVTNVSTFENKVFVQGIKKDGTLMDKKYWVKKGYERRIEKFDKPGRTERIPKERMEKMEKEIIIRKVDKRDIKKSDAKTRQLDSRVISDKDALLTKDKAAITDRIDTIQDREDVKDKIEMMEERQEIIDKRTTVIEKKEDVKETNTDAIRDVSDLKRLEDLRTKPPTKPPLR